MKVDFHCHTTASDGALKPQQLIDLAVQYDVATLAITDHDTTQGYSDALEYASQKNIRLISGVEASCDWQGHTIHIVGLDFDHDHPTLQNGLRNIRHLRQQRADAMIEKLSSRPNFSKLDLAALLAEQVQDGVVGRGHFAQLLIQQNYVKNSQQAFDKYLKKGRVGYVKSEWPELVEVVNWIKQANGIAVIAHPSIYKFTSRKLNRLIEDFIAAGGRGIEVVNQPRPSSEIIGMAERAQRYELLASVGSDFHRPEHNWRGLGWLAPLPDQCRPVWEHFRNPLKTLS
ncbi:PHP domain-containing protein [Thiomicrorhabdus sp.]|uniref:PHP domain-containing protein n=1 Tax=Thiomicrorhabdus sp. TaxID=2039724 RepID=UPI0035625492